MLYDLEPSVKVKGNAFYTTDGEFDDEFVNVLNDQLEKHISKRVRIHPLPSLIGVACLTQVLRVGPHWKT